MTTPDRRAALAVEAVDLRYAYPDGTTALAGISLSIERGEALCLAGPNGAGKSTLLLALAGLLRAEGTLSVEGQTPSTNQQLGLVFQDPDDQLFCAAIAEDVAFGPRNQKLAEAEVARRVTDSLQRTELAGYEKRTAHHLSGGEKKRAAIAAVLACQPAVLALDEPWANLDARGAAAVTRIIQDFTGTRIVASQDLYRAAEVCPRIVVIDQGHVVADGPVAQILADTRLLDQHGLEFGHRCRFCPERTGPAPGA